ncbi:hypothetical protein AWH56_011790 [Anaerobacillus isosaccharinicus]|uniref:Lipoprotein n=1 Tax=Anaerobacillus isosaccharinicus TaxID=1532552 RepID=A0A1S2LVY0_9BACI|nr:hypothetical protein [Anaerobacillus isosaccharinicus]MBA5588420.1 hypothetical protein [Anaerobacillus isosaccharinicus]QOY38150.1 hypothetical protein AWH56_011790 [Anaerobacillus isosaccharinicus]
MKKILILSLFLLCVFLTACTSTDRDEASFSNVKDAIEHVINVEEQHKNDIEVVKSHTLTEDIEVVFFTNGKTLSTYAALANDRGEIKIDRLTNDVSPGRINSETGYSYMNSTITLDNHTIYILIGKCDDQMKGVTIYNDFFSEDLTVVKGYFVYISETEIRTERLNIEIY